LIQTITGLFTKKDDNKEQTKELPKASPGKSPSVKDKFPLLKQMTPKKEKSKVIFTNY
jgi:hypothetical protein